jgi:hypothetical protein
VLTIASGGFGRGWGFISLPSEAPAFIFLPLSSFSLLGPSFFLLSKAPALIFLVPAVIFSTLTIQTPSTFYRGMLLALNKSCVKMHAETHGSMLLSFKTKLAN